MDKIRLLLVDDYVPVRDVLKQLLGQQEDMQVVGEVGDTQDIMKKIRELLPDVVLMDVSLPGRGALEATRAIRSESPSTHVVWLTTVADDVYGSEATKAGASACVSKASESSRLLASIRSTYALDRGIRPCA